MNDELKLTLSLQEINIVLNGLGELAAKLSMPVIQKIQEQAQPQIVPEPIPQPTEEQALCPESLTYSANLLVLSGSFSMPHGPNDLAGVEPLCQFLSVLRRAIVQLLFQLLRLSAVWATRPCKVLNQPRLQSRCIRLLLNRLLYQYRQTHLRLSLIHI